MTIRLLPPAVLEVGTLISLQVNSILSDVNVRVKNLFEMNILTVKMPHGLRQIFELIPAHRRIEILRGIVSGHLQGKSEI